MKTSIIVLAISAGAFGHLSPMSAIHFKPKTTCSEPVCKDITLSITAEANNTVFPSYPNSTAPGAMYTYLQSFNASTLPHTLVSGTFNISATYCEPSVKVAGRENTVQFLLHGLTSSKKYWSGIDFPDPTFQGEYSWVSHAASQGYSTLAIDNLGNGNSSRPDPIAIVQPTLQVAVIHNILSSLHAGSLPYIPKYNKVVMASHSYGSILARLISTIFPTSGADAYILTAASSNLTGIEGAIKDWEAQSASAVDPRFPHLLPAYVSISPSSVANTIYGLPGQFDPAILAWDEQTSHVFAVGEIASQSPALSSIFAGPVLVLTGREDQIVCGNGSIADVPDCGVGPGSIPDLTRGLFLNASRFDSFMPEGTAHSINTQFSAPESFGAAHAWLQSVGF